MAKWWKEIWAVGEGRHRTYCGVARTADGYAVDLFRGDACIASEIHQTRADAERAAAELERSHGAHPRPRASAADARPRHASYAVN